MTKHIYLTILIAFGCCTAQAGELNLSQRIDASLAEEIPAAANSKSVALTDDEVFLRRVSLDLIGRAPTASEVTKFTLDPSAQKREIVVRELLSNEKYGENWARYWRDVIMYRRTEQRALIAAQPLAEYLTKELNANAPWSKVATDMITAAGSVTDNGQAALIVAQEGRPEETVAEISRIFLGIQIQCAQCHDHKTDRWKREQFHQLAAFFPRVAARPELLNQRTILVDVNDMPFSFRRGKDNNRFRGTPEHHMPDLEHPDREGKTMQPIFFLTGQSLPLGSKDSVRRSSLAKWITSTDNVYFAKAVVNRMWAELVGEGFYEAIDEIGPDHSPTAPRTLELLAKEFAAKNYDMKWLMQTIIATNAYQRESRPRRNGNEAAFQANCAQRLRSDQLFNNLLNVLNLAEPARSANYGPFAAARDPRFAFQVVFGYDPSEPRDDVQGSIPQALAMMNSPIINNALRASSQSWLGQMLAKTPKESDAILELYLKTFAREPSQQETATCLAYVKEVGNRAEAYEDLLWSLINSTEFLHRR